MLEVLVAFSILALSLAVIFQIFSTGLRAAALSDDYTRAIALAETKLVELGRKDRLKEGIEEGTFEESLHWKTEVRLVQWWERAGGERLPVRPYEVTVKVFWGRPGKERSVSLATFRLGSAP